MGMNSIPGRLSQTEEAFLQALLWEEGHLLNGPATQAAHDHGLSLLRCLEPVNRLVQNLQGESLNHIQKGSCPESIWPWGEMNGDQVLRLLWQRLADSQSKSNSGDFPGTQPGERPALPGVAHGS